MTSPRGKNSLRLVLIATAALGVGLAIGIGYRRRQHKSRWSLKITAQCVVIAAGLATLWTHFSAWWPLARLLP